MDDEDLASITDGLQSGEFDRVISTLGTNRPPSLVMTWMWLQNRYLCWLWELDFDRYERRIAQVADEAAVEFTTLSVFQDDDSVPTPVRRVHFVSTILGLATLGLCLGLGAVGLDGLLAVRSPWDMVVPSLAILSSILIFTLGPVVPMLPFAVSNGFKEAYADGFATSLPAPDSDESVLVLWTPQNSVSKHLRNQVEQEYGGEYEVDHPDTEKSMHMPVRKRAARGGLWLIASSLAALPLILW